MRVLLIAVAALMLPGATASALASSPGATTGTATPMHGDICLPTSNSAAVTGVLDPGGEATSYQFEYGRSVAYGSMTPTRTTSSAGPVSDTLTGLTFGTYHYRLIATNSSGSAIGLDGMVTITPSAVPAGACDPPPLPVTGAASILSRPPACGSGTGTISLTGKIASSRPFNNYTAYFQYGATPSYGMSTSSQTLGDGPVSATITVGPGVYHYRLVAAGAAGPVYGSDATTGTPIGACAPSPGGPGARSNPTLQLVGGSISGTTVRVILVCRGAGGQTCKATAALRSTERRRGSTPIAVSARKQKQSIKTRRITDSTANYSAPAGTTTTLALPLNAAARALLRRFKRLASTLTLNGVPVGTVTFKVKQTKKAKHPTKRHG